MPTRPLNLALLGATGLVGRAVLEVLEASDLPVASLRLFASPRSDGTKLEFQGDELPVHAPKDGSFRGCDVALLAAGAEVARAWAPKAWAEGCAAVDASPAFRMEAEVPLVVPEVNPGAVEGFRRRGVVSTPGGAVTPLAVALAPLRAAAGLERVVVSTYQAVSGAGHRAVAQLEREVADLMNGRAPEAAAPLPHRIAFNLLPQVGAALPDGRTEEERSLAEETRKVLGDAALRVAATAVRVPIFYGHALAVNVRTGRRLGADEARELLRKAPGVKVVDAPAEGVYPMPMLAVNDDAVLVGRIREDLSQDNGLDLFVVADDLRRAATSLVKLAELVGGRL